jgi:heat shock protein HtpX
LIAGDTGVARRVVDNKRRAVLAVLAAGAFGGLIVALLSLLFLPAVGALFVFVVVAAALAGLAWWGSEPLARRLIDAQPADPLRHARLFNLMEALCVNAGVPPPSLYVVADAGLNALTIGRTPRHATLIVTEGLLQHLNRVELEGVLAHELAHVKSDDILISTVSVALFGILGSPARAAARGGAGAIGGYVLLPFSAAAGLGLQLVVGRQREEAADLSAVGLTRYPPALVAALEKMQESGTLVRTGGAPTAHLWLGDPVGPPDPDRLGWLSRLFETHPPLDARIEALREL